MHHHEVGGAPRDPIDATAALSVRGRSSCPPPPLGLRSLTISSPGLSHGLPPYWLYGGGGARVGGMLPSVAEAGLGGLTRLVLHGARVPWRRQQRGSGLCCLEEMTQVGPPLCYACSNNYRQHMLSVEAVQGWSLALSR